MVNRIIRFLIILSILSIFSLAGCKVEQNHQIDRNPHTYPEIDIGYERVVITENEKLKMMVDFAPLNILIEDKATGKIWSTNPIEADLDPVANSNYMGFMKSQITFTYITNRNLKTVDSFTESIETEQYRLFRINNGVRIEYTIGEMGLTVDDIPQILTAKRADTLFLQNSKLAQDQKDSFTACYQQTEDKTAWEYLTNNFGSKVNDLLDVYKAIGYTQQDLQKDAAEFGETVTIIDKIGFRIPVEYTIEGGDLITFIPTDEIEYPSENQIIELSVNDYFGAATSDLPGYVFIPDGSGALMHFDNKVHKDSELVIPVYSNDAMIGKGIHKVNTHSVLMPVYGLKTGDDAFFAIIEKGDAICNLKINRAMSNSSYNTICPKFTIHAKDNMFLGTSENLDSVTVLQHEPYLSDIKIRYHFMQRGNSSYQKMAEYYRNYLSYKDNVSSLKEQSEIPFFLETVGAVETQKNFLGVNYTGIESLTTFEQTKKIYSELYGKGVSKIVVKLSGWFNGGYEQRIANNVSIEKKLGGQKKLQQLIQQCENIFPAVTLFTTPSSRGVSLTSQASRTIDERYGRTYRIDLNLNDYLPDRYILSPSFYPQLIDKFLKEFNKTQSNILCIEESGSDIFADYSKNRNIDRQQSLGILIDEIKKVDKNLQELMLVNANIHTAAYADYLLEVPMESSSYSITDESVPFYQMILHGSVPYTGDPLNLSARNTDDYLKMVLLGASPYYKVVYSGKDKIISAINDDLYSVQFNDWEEIAVQQYKKANAVLREVQNCFMIDYQKLDEMIYQTSYSNGKSIIVNFGESEWKNGEEIVPAKNFIMVVTK